MKEIFKVMPKYSDAPLPPLDEEMLADLAKIPAVLEGEFWPQQPCSGAAVRKSCVFRRTSLCKYPAPRFKHNWGTAEKLYKSEAAQSPFLAD